MTEAQEMLIFFLPFLPSQEILRDVQNLFQEINMFIDLETLLKN